MRRNAPAKRVCSRSLIGLVMLFDGAIVAAQQPPSDNGAGGAPATGTAESATAKQTKLNAETVQLMRLKRRTLSELKLAPDKARKISKMFDEHLELMQENQSTSSASPAHNGARMRDLDEQIAKARAAGDRQALGKLASRRQQFKSGKQSGMDHNRLRDRVLAELDDTQGTQFRPMFRDSMQSRSQRGGGGLRSLQSMRKTLQTLQLTAEQKRATDKLFQELKPRLKKAREQGRAEVKRIVDGFKKEILALLTPEQRAAFEAAEQKNANRRGANRQGNNRGGQRSKGRQGSQGRPTGKGNNKGKAKGKGGP